MSMLFKYIFLLQTLQTNFLVLEFPGGGSADEISSFKMAADVVGSSTVLHSKNEMSVINDSN